MTKEEEKNVMEVLANEYFEEHFRTYDLPSLDLPFEDWFNELDVFEAIYDKKKALFYILNGREVKNLFKNNFKNKYEELKKKNG